MDKIKLDSQKIRRYPIYERGQGARLSQKGEAMSHFTEVDRQARMIEAALYDADRATDTRLVRLDCAALAFKPLCDDDADDIAARLMNESRFSGWLHDIACTFAGESFDDRDEFECAARRAYARYFAALFC